MKIIATIAFYWVGLSAAAAIAIARALGIIPDNPPRPPRPRPVDDWTPVTVDAAFSKIVAEWVQR